LLPSAPTVPATLTAGPLALDFHLGAGADGTSHGARKPDDPASRKSPDGEVRPFTPRRPTHAQLAGRIPDVS
jgi:hypothetical protein